MPRKARAVEAVLGHLLDQTGPVTRPAIAKAVGLSAPAVTYAIDQMRPAGLVVDAGLRHGGRGRNAILYELPLTAGTLVGVDLGGNNVRVAITDLRGCVVVETTEETAQGDERTSQADAIVAQVGEIVERLRGSENVLTEAPTLAGGVSMPGVVRPDDGRLQFAWNLGDAGAVDLVGKLASRLGIKLSGENNVSLAAVGEQWRGVGAELGLQDFAVVSVGAGIGAGIIHGGRLVRGANGAGGEVAFLPLSDTFHRSRVASADDAGGVNLLARAQATRGWGADGPPTSVADLFARAERGDSSARRLVANAARQLARVVASIAAVMDPEMVVMAGGVGSNPQLIEQTTRALADIAPFPPPLRLSALGARASLVGAIALATTSSRESLLDSARELG